MQHEGGCLCGALRFSARADALDTGYCHCALCRRSTGAPVLAWASFPVEDFRYVTGEPAIFRSSSHGHREFCNRCGTQIAFRESRDARTVDVNVGSLDDPEAAPPRCHIYCRSQLSWLQTSDALPRYQAGPPKHARA